MGETVWVLERWSGRLHGAGTSHCCHCLQFQAPDSNYENEQASRSLCWWDGFQVFVLQATLEPEPHKTVPPSSCLLRGTSQRQFSTIGLTEAEIRAHAIARKEC